MYSYTLYNNNCILQTDTNKIIFEGENGWNEFELWKKENPKLHEKLLKEKQIKLKWNQGFPHTINSDKHFYNEDGELYKIDKGDIIEHLSNGRIYQLDELNKQTTKFTEDGVVFEKINYKTNTLKKYHIASGKLLYFNRTKNDFKYSIEYFSTNDESESIYKSTLYKKDILLKEQINFPSTNIKTILKYKNDSYSYKEYYITGIVRGEGKLTSERKMKDEWKFYHQNGKIESIHFFKNGVLSKTSKLYSDNGKLYKQINHD
tara:strand:+ start:393 stop:1175 length:783 start_codon:yes stop_codon:yes gene_type:complete